MDLIKLKIDELKAKGFDVFMVLSPSVMHSERVIYARKEGIVYVFHFDGINEFTRIEQFYETDESTETK